MGILNNTNWLIMTAVCQWNTSKYRLSYERSERNGEEAWWFRAGGLPIEPQTTDCLVSYLILLD